MSLHRISLGLTWCSVVGRHNRWACSRGSCARSGASSLEDGRRRALEIDAPATARGSQVGDSVAIRRLLPDRRCRGRADRLRRRAGDARAHGARNPRPGVEVNVEPALRAGEPLGGHYVQGHVDGVGTVRSGRARGGRTAPLGQRRPALLRYVVEKGSITVEGTSLTVAGLDDAGFAVALIPHTLTATTLGELEPGDRVNLETDVLAKYVERLLHRRWSCHEIVWGGA